MNDQPVFRAIAHPARRQIMAQLAVQKMSVKEVADLFEMTRPAVSKHLGILKDADLISTHRKGRKTLNQLNPNALKPVSDWLQFYSVFWDQKLNALKKSLENENG